MPGFGKSARREAFPHSLFPHISPQAGATRQARSRLRGELGCHPLCGPLVVAPRNELALRARWCATPWGNNEIRLSPLPFGA